MNSGFITNGTTQDGFGARMHRVINTIAFVYYLRENFNSNRIDWLNLISCDNLENTLNNI